MNLFSTLIVRDQTSSYKFSLTPQTSPRIAFQGPLPPYLPGLFLFCRTEKLWENTGQRKVCISTEWLNLLQPPLSASVIDLSSPAYNSVYAPLTGGCAIIFYAKCVSQTIRDDRRIDIAIKLTNIAN